MQAFKYEKEVHEGAGKWLFSAIRWTRHKQTNQHENRVMMQEATHLPSDTFHTIPHYSRMITFLFFLAWLCCCQATKGKGIICTQNTNCVYRAWLDIQLLYLETKISRRHHETERENSSDILAHLFPPNNRGVLSLNLFHLISRQLWSCRGIWEQTHRQSAAARLIMIIWCASDGTATHSRSTKSVSLPTTKHSRLWL